jgi:hypothetical protein
MLKTRLEFCTLNSVRLVAHCFVNLNLSGLLVCSKIEAK